MTVNSSDEWELAAELDVQNGVSFAPALIDDSFSSHYIACKVIIDNSRPHWVAAGRLWVSEFILGEYHLSTCFNLKITVPRLITIPSWLNDTYALFTDYLFNLPPLALNMLFGGVTIFIACLGYRVATAPELSLKSADTQLSVSNSASQLKELSDDLKKQAEAIKAKDEAYNSLSITYEQSLKGKEGYGKLQAAIETIDSLPSPDNIDAIQEDIQETESGLSEKLVLNKSRGTLSQLISP